MDDCEGYIQVPAMIVKQACEHYLKEDREMRERWKEEHIEREMNKKWFPANTREKAIERGNEPFKGLWWEWEGSFCKWKVERLLELATVAVNLGERATDPTISTDMAKLLKDSFTAVTGD